MFVGVRQTAMAGFRFPFLPQPFEGFRNIFWVLVFDSGLTEGEEYEKEA